MALHGRSPLKELDLTREEFLYLVDLGGRLRDDKRLGFTRLRLADRNIALIFEKASTRTRSAFEVAAHDEGAHVTRPRCWPTGQPSHPEMLSLAARLTWDIDGVVDVSTNALR